MKEQPTLILALTKKQAQALREFYQEQLGECAWGEQLGAICGQPDMNSGKIAFVALKPAQAKAFQISYAIGKFLAGYKVWGHRFTDWWGSFSLGED